MLLRQDDTWQDPRVTRTRQLLQQALTDLMAEKNFEAITVQDIAARATVNRVTFYAHFQDKYALLEYSVREAIRQRLQRDLPGAAHLSPENLARLIQTVCEFMAEMSGHCPPPRGQMEPLMEKQVKEELYEVLLGWLAERPSGRTRAQEREKTELAAMVASWAIYGAAVQWSKKEKAMPAAAFAQQVLPLILAGLDSSKRLPVR
jgi:AcrR family transcriptional regulator